MAAPATTARSTPTGIHLDEGFSTLIAFARDVTVSFWERIVKPLSLDGQDKIDVTTMHNTKYMTSRPGTLIEIGDTTSTVGWDPNVYNNIIDNLLLQEGSITVNLPDGSTIDFYGFLRLFDPGDMEKNAFPEASVEIVATNWDSVNSVEQGPVFTSVSGT